MGATARKAIKKMEIRVKDDCSVDGPNPQHIIGLRPISSIRRKYGFHDSSVFVNKLWHSLNKNAWNRRFPAHGVVV